ncbi:ras-related protein Rab-36 isoform X4 [Manis javanica]|uniref:ras-related protein Rab-36 isoform X4 n=1 Tax=Manis javanica TaxID=9974 RepID=UPI003C6D9E3A
MRSSLMPLGPPVSRDRIITSFPKWYTPNACLQLREHFHGQVSTVCQSRNTGTAGLKLSKVVVVGDLYVGKTSLIHRFCKNVFDRDYKATIGVDFEIERFEIAGIPYSLQIWDTAGQEKFKCIASAYYRGAQDLEKAKPGNKPCVPGRGLELRPCHFCCGPSPEGMTPPGDSSRPVTHAQHPHRHQLLRLLPLPRALQPSAKCRGAPPALLTPQGPAACRLSAVPARGDPLRTPTGPGPRASIAPVARGAEGSGLASLSSVRPTPQKLLT